MSEIQFRYSSIRRRAVSRSSVVDTGNKVCGAEVIGMWRFDRACAIIAGGDHAKRRDC